MGGDDEYVDIPIDDMEREALEDNDAFDDDDVVPASDQEGEDLDENLDK